MRHRNIMYRYCYFLKTYFLLLCWYYEPQVEAIAPTFLVPVSSTLPRSVNENSPKDLSILTVEGQDGDGDALTFSIETQNPNLPPFELDSTTGLLKTPNGLDAETTQSFNFTFGVSDGTTNVGSVIFTVNINDLNDNAPQFVGTPYTASLLDSVGNGTIVDTVSATDADVTPATISYNITGGNTGSTFAIDAGNGQITVAISANLNGMSTFNLNVEASDGTLTSTSTVTVTVSVDYCATNPCQNGGVCTNGETTHTCRCASGYTGTNCTEIVDNCASNPCQNDGTCNNGLNFYNCTCAEHCVGTNCQECAVKDDSDCDCCLCWLIVLVVPFIFVAVAGVWCYKKGTCAKLPFLGKCFKDKSTKPDKDHDKQKEPLHAEKGYGSESGKVDKHEKSIGVKPVVHQEGNLTDKNKLPKTSEKCDDIVTTGRPRTDAVGSKKFAVNNGENLNDNKHTEVKVETSAM